nr:DUF3618 domain-containing protein [Paracoccus saliphilus]
MTTESDNPEQLEREIEADRDALRQTLDSLQDEFSLDGLSRRLSSTMREHGSEWVGSASDAARANPVALALTGVGLAWLIFGRGYDPTHTAQHYYARRSSHDDHRRSYPDHDDDHEPHAERTTTRVTTYPPTPATRTRPASWTGYGETRDAGSSSLHSGSQKDESSMTDNMKDRARHLRERLSEGTEGFSDEARRRVEGARRRALEASDSASRRFDQSSRAVSEGYDAQPLLFGAASFLLGAGLAALLPRTERENEMMGSYSDQLFHEAEAIFEEEKARVQAAVSAGVDEAKASVSNVTNAAEKELSKDRHDSGATSDSSKASSTGSSSGSGSTTGATGSSSRSSSVSGGTGTSSGTGSSSGSGSTGSTSGSGTRV